MRECELREVESPIFSTDERPVCLTDKTMEERREKYLHV